MPTSPSLTRIGISTALQPDIRGYRTLEHLAQRLDTLEVHLHEAQLPPLASVQVWTRLVRRNPRFRFSIQVPAAVTAGRNLSDTLVAGIRRVLDPLESCGLLGAVVLAFPWTFRFNQENRAFLIAARRAFHNYRLAAEMRHASWAAEEALGVLIDYHLSFVNIDQPPHVNAMPPSSYLTAPIGYARLLGRASVQGRADHAADACDCIYSPTELQEWMDRVDRMRRFAADCYVIFANRSEERGLANATAWTGRAPRIPSARQSRIA